jgi:hypothetical protein
MLRTGNEEEKITLADLVWCVASIEESLDAFVDPFQPPEFLRFDATGDTLFWLISCKHYFHVRRMQAHKRVAYASFNLLDDAQLWYYQLSDDGGPPLWDKFVKRVVTWFVPPLTGKPISTSTLVGDAMALEGVGGSDILAAGYDTLHVDDSSNALHAEGGSGVVAGGDARRRHR